jgi:zinc transport system substrate-binding protein
MRLAKISAAGLIISLLFAPAFSWEQSGAPRLKIVVSIFPLMEFARAVAGDNAEVNLLLPPGAGVHTWQPRASDVIKMSEADLFICVGAGLEPWVADLLKSLSNKRPRVLAAADFLPLEKEKHAGKEVIDPHVWLDFAKDQIVVERLARVLGEIDASRASIFSEHAAIYNQKLKALDAEYAVALRSCAQRILLVGGHDAFGYLARRYELEQVSLAGLSPDAEPTPSRVTSIIDMARKKRVGAVFVEANTNPKLARLLGREIPAELFVLNPGENLNKKEWTSGLTFFDIMEDNLKNLKKGLRCD